MMNIPVYGIVENFSYFKCPDCGKEHKIFGSGATEAAAVAHRCLGGRNAAVPVGSAPSDVPVFARAAVAALDGMGLLDGIDRTKLAGKTPLTRADAASLVAGMIRETTTN